MQTNNSTKIKIFLQDNRRHIQHSNMNLDVDMGYVYGYGLPNFIFAKWQAPARVGLRSSRSEKWKNEAFTLFREVQSEKNMLSLFFEKWKVKSKCFETEIEKWKFSRIPDNSRETRFYNRIIRQGGGGGRLPRWLHPLGVSIDYTWRADDLEEDLDKAEYEDIDDMKGESEEE